MKIFMVVLWIIATVIGTSFICTGTFVNPIAYTLAAGYCLLSSIDDLFNK